MSRIIKGNLAKENQIKKIETLQLPSFDCIQDDIEENTEKQPSAQEILTKANTKKQKIIEQAKSEAMEIAAKIRQDAFNQGYMEGKELAKEELEKNIQVLAEKNKKWEKDIKFHQAEIIERAGIEVKEISFCIAKKIIGEIAQEKEDLVNDLYKMLIPLVVDKEIIEIKINEKDYDFLRGFLGQTIRNHETRLTIDNQISEKSIYVETNQGYLLKDIEKEFNEIVNELRKVYG